MGAGVNGAATVTFEAESFTWSGGIFEVRGRWSDEAAGLGRVRLLVEVDGRRRDIGAQGGKNSGGEDWRARFMCGAAPEPGAAAALKVAGIELELPGVQLAEPPAEPDPAKLDLLAELKAERAAADVARQRLARERRAAEEVEARLVAARRRGGAIVPAAESPGGEEVTALGYVVAGLIAVLFVVLLLLVL